MISRLEQLCLDKGLKMTEQRRVIARVLSDSADHPDVEQVYRRATAIDPHISIATVYRTVRLFEEANILARHDFGDGRSRYEEMPSAHHDHLIDLQIGPGDRVPQRGDRKAAADRRRSARLRSGRPSARALCRAAHRQASPIGMTAAATECRVAALSRPRRGAWWRGCSPVPVERCDRRLAFEPAADDRPAGAGPGRVVDIAPARCRFGSPIARPTSRPRRRCAIASSTKTMGARADSKRRARRRDFDGSTQAAIICWCSTSTRRGRGRSVVGTYRLIRREAAARLGGFYSAARIRHRAARRLSPASARTRPFLRRRGLPPAAGDAAALERHRRLCLPLRHRPDVRLREPARHRSRSAGRAAFLSLSPSSRAPGAARARPARALCRDAPAAARGIDPARALAALPPLVKGYLRLGGFVGDGAVIDREFNTTDVCVVVKTDLVSEKYSRHYVRRSKHIENAGPEPRWTS